MLFYFVTSVPRIQNVNDHVLFQGSKTRQFCWWIEYDIYIDHILQRPKTDR